MYHSETINGYTFRMLYIMGGTFLMGDPRKNVITQKVNLAHQVQLSPYYIGEHLVTQSLWSAVIGIDHNPSHFVGDKRPVEQISWIDIMEGNQDENGQPAFINRINELTKDTRPEGYVYTLPSEAQWEYAARAGTNHEYAGSDQLKEVGWYDHNSHGETKEMGLLLPNNFGLYDFSGNVWEWCLDHFSGKFFIESHQLDTVINPVNTKSSSDNYPLHVLRGGSYMSPESHCLVYTRYLAEKTENSSDIGSRLVLAPVSTP